MFKLRFLKCNCTDSVNCQIQELEIIKGILKFYKGNLENLILNLDDRKHYRVIYYLLDNYKEIKFKEISVSVKLLEILLENSRLQDQILEKIKVKALKRNSVDILETIVPKFAKTEIKDLQKIITKAYITRIFIGFNRKYDSIITIVLKGIQEEELDIRGDVIIKSLCEIGCLDGLKEILKTVNVNISDGIALFTSVTSGNVNVVSYLLSLRDIDTSFFTLYSLLFTLGIIIVEIFALLVFSFLVASWISTLIMTGSGVVSSSAVLELSCISVPCLLGMISLYNLIPVHKVIYALYLLYRSKSVGAQARVYSQV